MSDITVRPLSTSQHPRGMAYGNNYFIRDLILAKKRVPLLKDSALGINALDKMKCMHIFEVLTFSFAQNFGHKDCF